MGIEDGTSRGRLSPKESKEVLMSRIRERGEVNLPSLLRMARRERMSFGPGIDALDVILAWRDLGKISINMEGFSDETRKSQIMILSKPF